MKKLTFCSAIIAGVLLTAGLNPAMAADDDSKSSLQSRMEEVNSTVSKSENMDTAMQRIATETGVSIDRVRAMHENYPDAKAGGLLVACVLADETKKAPGTFLKQHESGKSWATIAEDNNVSVATLNARLERLQQSLNGEK